MKTPKQKSRGDVIKYFYVVSFYANNYLLFKFVLFQMYLRLS